MGSEGERDSGSKADRLGAGFLMFNVKAVGNY